ncbi:benzodiazepine receptor family protein [Penicillium brasilianum]|uniref:Benzodiazepine receptor family protein n=1 Tax=Penicillium brasilianum TaxID=104259 RepID=A0A1S9REG0_PENBI|nr:benzodiazepine receptor family protein [Penicillium brasilianum]
MPWSFALPQAIFTSPLLAIATPIAVGTTSALLTNRTNTKETYTTLRQPPFSPPAWLFGPAWTLLYGLMGYASHHATALASQSLIPAVHEANRSAQTLYTTQLGLNFIWMPLFFGLGRPATALGDMALLIGNVSLLLANWWDADRTAFWLMAPYLGWLGYAAYLNAGVGYLNGWTLPKKKREE